jgi:hypothetical protein
MVQNRLRGSTNASLAGALRAFSTGNCAREYRTAQVQKSRSIRTDQRSKNLGEIINAGLTLSCLRHGRRLPPESRIAETRQWLASPTMEFVRGNCGEISE